jgi:hypothetical protein
MVIEIAKTPMIRAVDERVIPKNQVFPGLLTTGLAISSVIWV